MLVVKSPKTKEEFKEYYALRYAVLREPWGQPKGTEKDDYEPISEHFVVIDDASGEVVGAAKLFEKAPGVGYMSHLVVAKDHQNQGIGRLLVATIEEKARSNGYKVVGTMSRVTSTAFFEKYGFHIAGLPSLHLGPIKLVWMEKEL